MQHDPACAIECDAGEPGSAGLGCTCGLDEARAADIATPLGARTRARACDEVRDEHAAAYDTLIARATAEPNIKRKTALAALADVASCQARRAKQWADQYRLIAQELEEIDTP